MARISERIGAFASGVGGERDLVLAPIVASGAETFRYGLRLRGLRPVTTSTYVPVDFKLRFKVSGLKSREVSYGRYSGTVAVCPATGVSYRLTAAVSDPVDFAWRLRAEVYTEGCPPDEPGLTTSYNLQRFYNNLLIYNDPEAPAGVTCMPRIAQYTVYSDWFPYAGLTEAATSISPQDVSGGQTADDILGATIAAMPEVQGKEYVVAYYAEFDGDAAGRTSIDGSSPVYAYPTRPTEFSGSWDAGATLYRYQGAVSLSYASDFVPIADDGTPYHGGNAVYQLTNLDPGSHAELYWLSTGTTGASTGTDQIMARILAGVEAAVSGVVLADSPQVLVLANLVELPPPEPGLRYALRKSGGDTNSYLFWLSEPGARSYGDWVVLESPSDIVVACEIAVLNEPWVGYGPWRGGVINRSDKAPVFVPLDYRPPADMTGPAVDVYYHVGARAQDPVDFQYRIQADVEAEVRIYDDPGDGGGYAPSSVSPIPVSYNLERFYNLTINYNDPESPAGLWRPGVVRFTVYSDWFDRAGLTDQFTVDAPKEVSDQIAANIMAPLIEAYPEIEFYQATYHVEVIGEAKAFTNPDGTSPVYAYPARTTDFFGAWDLVSTIYPYQGPTVLARASDFIPVDKHGVPYGNDDVVRLLEDLTPHDDAEIYWASLDAVGESTLPLDQIIARTKADSESGAAQLVYGFEVSSAIPIRGWFAGTGGSQTTSPSDTLELRCDHTETVTRKVVWRGSRYSADAPVSIPEGQEVVLGAAVVNPAHDPTWSSEITNLQLAVDCDNPNVDFRVPEELPEFPPDRVTVEVPVRARVRNQRLTPWFPELEEGYYYLNSEERFLHSPGDVLSDPVIVHGHADTEIHFAVQAFGLEHVPDQPASVTDDLTGTPQGTGTNVRFDQGVAAEDPTMEAVFESAARPLLVTVDHWWPMTWTDRRLGDGAVTMEVASGLDDVFASWAAVENGEVPAIPPGNMVKYRARLVPGTAMREDPIVFMDDYEPDFEATESANATTTIPPTWFSGRSTVSDPVSATHPGVIIEGDHTFVTGGIVHLEPGAQATFSFPNPANTVYVQLAGCDSACGEVDVFIDNAFYIRHDTQDLGDTYLKITSLPIAPHQVMVRAASGGKVYLEFAAAAQESLPQGYITIRDLAQGRATVLSAVKDCTADVAWYGRLNWGGVIPAGSSVKFYTVSADSPNGPWDGSREPWRTLGGNGAIRSVVKRYLRWVAELDTDGLARPLLDFVQITANVYGVVPDPVRLLSVTIAGYREAHDRPVSFPVPGYAQISADGAGHPLTAEPLVDFVAGYMADQEWDNPVTLSSYAVTTNRPDVTLTYQADGSDIPEITLPTEPVTRIVRDRFVLDGDKRFRVYPAPRGTAPVTVMTLDGRPLRYVPAGGEVDESSFEIKYSTDPTQDRAMIAVHDDALSPGDQVLVHFNTTQSSAVTGDIDLKPCAHLQRDTYLFLAGTAEPASITVTLGPNPARADQKQLVTGRAVVLDALGNPVKGETVSFVSTPPVFIPPARTDIAGVVAFTVPVPKAIGELFVTAQAGTISHSASIQFVSQVNVWHLDATASHSIISATEPVEVWVRVLDESRMSLSNVPVRLFASGAVIEAGGRKQTRLDGIATFVVWPDGAPVIPLTASVKGPDGRLYTVRLNVKVVS